MKNINMNEVWKSSMAWQTVDKEKGIVNPARVFRSNTSSIIVIYNSKGEVITIDEFV